MVKLVSGELKKQVMNSQKTDRREFQDENDKNRDPEWKNANRDKQQKEDKDREENLKKNRINQQKK